MLQKSSLSGDNWLETGLGEGEACIIRCYVTVFVLDFFVCAGNKLIKGAKNRHLPPHSTQNPGSLDSRERLLLNDIDNI